MLQKRLQEEGHARSEGTSNPEDKRRRTTFENVLPETMKWEPNLEDLIRKVVREEVQSAVQLAVQSVLGKVLNNMKQTCEKETQPSELRILQLQFLNSLSSTVYTGAWIKGEESSHFQVALVDYTTRQKVKSGPESSAKVEIVVLEGDFDGEEGDNWTPEEFQNNIVREREGKKSLLTGEAVLNLYEGVGSVSKISFTDNSSWTRSGRFRLGARVVDNFDGTRVREAKTESFKVKDQRGEVYKKHHPPALSDEVWRLENIRKDGAFHKHLTQKKICTVKDFLIKFFTNRQELRTILGTSMPNKKWEVTVEHARKCILDKRIHLYCPPGSQQRTGVVFNVVGQVLYLLLECERIPQSNLSETQKVDAQNMVLSAFEQWGEVVSFDDEASLLGGGSSNVATVLQTSSSPRGDDFPGSKFMATQKIGGFDYTQPPASSPDNISSIYSVGTTSGLDDNALHNIDGMGLRDDQTLTFPGQVTNSLICDPDPISRAFCDDDPPPFFDSDLWSAGADVQIQSPGADVQIQIAGADVQIQSPGADFQIQIAGADVPLWSPAADVPLWSPAADVPFGSPGADAGSARSTGSPGSPWPLVYRCRVVSTPLWSAKKPLCRRSASIPFEKGWTKLLSVLKFFSIRKSVRNRGSP